MMGMTHIFIGTASAMAVSSPHTVSGCFAAMIGGAAGGFISDIERLLLRELKLPGSFRLRVLSPARLCALV